MFVRIDARNNIVEATDMPNGKGYLAATGEMPLGLLGFNGRVYTPNYRLVDGVITNREASDIAREPYSDPAPQPTDAERIADLELSLCDIDEANEAAHAGYETALCDMDELLNGGTV